MTLETKNRSDLKSYFITNAIPTQSNFAELIDAMLNQADDGIFKLPGDPLSIVAAGDASSQKKTLHLYENAPGAGASPSWVLSLNPRSNPSDALTAKPGFSINDSGGQSRLFIDKATGKVGIGTVAPQATLHVNGAIMPSAGAAGGIEFPSNPGGGGGDGAWIRYYTRAGENTTLEIGTSNDAQDHIALMASGNVGIGINEPTHKLHVRAANAVGLLESTGTEAFLRFSTSEGLANRVELANRPGGRLALWTAGGGDVLNITKDGKVGIGTAAPTAKLHLVGNLDIDGGAFLGYEATISDFGSALKSGFYQNGGEDVTGDVPDSSHGWSHLITARHSNTGNNHQLQIASTYAVNDRIFFRKIAAGGAASSNPAWNELATRNTLDVLENFTATVRCADFRMGHSGRSNRLGRALVDGTDVLVINYNGDWPGGVRIWQVDWQPVSFQSGWVNYSSEYNPAGYFKDSCGMVHLRGLVKNGAIGGTICVLPGGFRPAHRQLHVCCTNSNVSGRVDVLADGRVIPVAGNAGWLSLDGISFRAV